MNTENLIYSSIALAGFLLLAAYIRFFVFPPVVSPVRSEKKQKKKESPQGKPAPDISVKEIFDYGKIKIMHENGIYTINDNGRVMTYKSWRYLPATYQKLVKQVDSGTLAQNRAGYFLDNINGIFYVTTPEGKKKKYNSMNDIPERIRKLL